MTEYHLEITKTARYYTCGALTEQTKQVWIVLHGWGMNIKSFAESFKPLVNETVFLIAPEALNRFYLKDLNGRVGACWMTTVERESEIEDYISYLDKVYETLILQEKAKIIALGFSQGAATIGRWAMKTRNKLNNIVFWGGSIPEECVAEPAKLNALYPYILVGDEDEYITAEKRETVMKTLLNNNVIFSHIFYKGGHAILTEPLMQLCSELTEP